MAILLVYSTLGEKSWSRPQNGGHLEMITYQTEFQFDLRYEKIVPNNIRKSIFHGDDVMDDVRQGPQSQPYKNEKRTFFMITEKRIKITASNLLYSCIMEL